MKGAYFYYGYCHLFFIIWIFRCPYNNILLRTQQEKYIKKNKPLLIFRRVSAELSLDDNQSQNKGKPSDENITNTLKIKKTTFETKDKLEETASCDEKEKKPVTGSFINEKGLKLQTYEWKVNNPKGIIILIHGYRAHTRLTFLEKNVRFVGNPDDLKNLDVEILSYNVYRNSWVDIFNRNNYSVYGMDLQGHGSSQGIHPLRCDVDEFDDYVRDISQFVQLINKSIENQHTEGISCDNPIPIYLLGVSMGGNIALRYIQVLDKSMHTCLLNIKGCIVLSGLVSLNRYRNRCFNKCCYLPLGKLIVRFFPTLPSNNSTKYKHKYLRKLVDDELSTKFGTLRLGAELLKSEKNLKRDIKHISKEVPLLFFHGKNDTTICPEDAIEFFDNLESSQKEFVLLDNMEHPLTHERDNKKILYKILDWLSLLSKD